MLGWLLDASDFITRDHCGRWPLWLSRTYITSNFIISASYLWIAAMLVVIHGQKWLPLPRPRLVLWFAGFIALCGLTHVTDVTVWAWATYRLYTMIFVVTAAVSLVTAVQLPGVTVLLARARGAGGHEAHAGELRRRLAANEQTLKELKRMNTLLAVRLEHLELLLETEGWTAEKAAALAEMRGTIEAIKGASHGS